MQQTIKLTPAQNTYYKELLDMTGPEIYDKYGLKRDETIVHTAYFDDGIEIDIKLVICDGDSKPYTEAVAFENSGQVAMTDIEDYFAGEWELSINDSDYTVTVVVEEA